MGIGIAYRLVSILVLAVVLVGGIAWLGSQITGLNPFREEEVLRVGPTVVQSIRDLSDLVTVEVVEYTTVEKGRDAGILNFARGDRIFLFAVARIGAGVDLSQIRDQDVDVDHEALTITIRLPEPRIIYAALDNEHTQVYDRDTGIFTRGDQSLETQARQTAEQVLREQAINAGILQRASDNAKLTLTAFLRSLGFKEVTIVGRSDER